MSAAAPFKRLAIVRADRIGDVVITSSCLAPMRQQFPETEIVWCIPAAMAPLFHRLESGVRLRGIEASRGWPRLREFYGFFAAEGIDAVALLQPDRGAEWGAVAARVPVRAGWSRARHWPQFLTAALPYAKSDGTKHEAAYNFDVLGLVGGRAPERFTPALSPDPGARDSLHAQLRAAGVRAEECAAFHLAAHGSKQRIPLRVAAELAGKLHRERGLRPLLIGTERDVSREQFAELADLAPSVVVDFRARTSLAESAWLLGDVALTIARDSGPAHLAAAMGGRVLTLFVDLRPLAGPTRWAPLGPRVRVAEIASLPAAESTLLQHRVDEALRA